MLQSRVRFLAVLASVCFFFRIGKHEYVIELLLYARDTPGILALDDVLDLFGQMQPFLFNDLTVLYHVDGDLMIDKTEHVKIQHIDAAFDLEYVLLAHLTAPGIHDHGDGTVKLIKLQIVIYLQALTGVHMIEHKSFFYLSDI